MARTHYQLLGVAPHASHDEIRRAYHRQALRHHPDANPDTGGGGGGARTGGPEAMAAINAAWEVLRDPERRRAYDRAIGTPPRPRPAGPAPRDEWSDDDDDDDDLRHLWDDPEPARRTRPSDLLVMVPVILLALAIATFAFSAMSESAGLRTAALLMTPVTAASFVAAPLFTMLRARSRDDSSR